MFCCFSFLLAIASCLYVISLNCIQNTLIEHSHKSDIQIESILYSNDFCKMFLHP